MRRIAQIASALLILPVLLTAVPPGALAQAPAAPAPKVTITGLIDNVVSLSRNLSFNGNDLNRGGFTDRSDREAFGWTRGRVDIIGQLGKARGVLGLEIDGVYGNTTATSGTGTGLNNLGKVVTNGNRPTGMGISFGPNTDNTAGIEIKWLYVTVPGTGAGSLLPFVPFEGTLTLGAQPYGLGLKPSILADSDFAGATYRVTFSPNVKASFTFTQLEEESTGNLQGFFRGDDWGYIVKVDVEPFKGLRVSPLYAYELLSGTTLSTIRRANGAYTISSANYAPDSNAGASQSSIFIPLVTGCIGPAPTVAGSQNSGTATLAGSRCRRTEEVRHFVGLDFRLDQGPFFINPTVIYQAGSRQRFTSATDPGSGGLVRMRTADIDAWIADVALGYRLGPVLFEVRALYTPGNEAGDNLNKSLHYYQPFQVDNSFLNGVCQGACSGSVGYLASQFGRTSNPLSPGGNVGYDRYGKALVSLKATYNFTPALSAFFGVTPIYTAEEVDTRNQSTSTTSGLGRPVAITNAAAGSNPTAVMAIAPCGSSAGAATGAGGNTVKCKGIHSYYGTDLSAGFTWRFAPGLAFDYGIGYILSGPALNSVVDRCVRAHSPACTFNAGDLRERESQDAYVTSARIRYTF